MQKENIPSDRAYIIFSIVLILSVFLCIYLATYFFVKDTPNEFNLPFLK